MIFKQQLYQMDSFSWFPVSRLVVYLCCLLRQMLSRLLNSSHPEDLKAANKLIKEMVQEVNFLFLLPASLYQLIYCRLITLLPLGLRKISTGII